MAGERLDNLRNNARHFLTVDVPGVYWGLAARIDITDVGWDSLVVGSYFDAFLHNGKLSEVRQRALGLLSSKDQKTAYGFASLGEQDRYIDVPAMPSQTELVRISRENVIRKSYPSSNILDPFYGIV